MIPRQRMVVVELPLPIARQPRRIRLHISWAEKRASLRELQSHMCGWHAEPLAIFNPSASDLRVQHRTKHEQEPCHP